MIMTIFYQHKRFNEAYVWALIAEKEDEEDEYPINLDLILKHGVMGGGNVISNETQLREIAQQYYEQLDKGIFQESAPQLNK